MELNDSRSSNGFSFNPISYSDILAYFQLKQIQPHDWEVDAIKRMDRETLKVYAEKAKQDSAKKS
jgi:hypothetical protein